MSIKTKLGGFKILKKAVSVSIVAACNKAEVLAKFFRILTEEKINILFLTIGIDKGFRGITAVADSSDTKKLVSVMDEHFYGLYSVDINCGILSVFPHKNDPYITGSLLEAFGKNNIIPGAVAYSNSAISVLIDDRLMEHAVDSLFGPFEFGSCRTPEDWRLVQQGKEELYKEIIASYHEERIKVYSLEWRYDQQLLCLDFNTGDLCSIGESFKKCSRKGIPLFFLVSCPLNRKGHPGIFLSSPSHKLNESYDSVTSIFIDAAITKVLDVGIFSMNGPHFGDRYGIAGRLLSYFDKNGVKPVAMGCSVASISCAVQASEVQKATDILKDCFDIPAIIERY